MPGAAGFAASCDRSAWEWVGCAIQAQHRIAGVSVLLTPVWGYAALPAR